MTTRKKKAPHLEDLSEDNIAKLSLAEQTVKNTYHIQTLNSEMGETRDMVRSLSSDMETLKLTSATVTADLTWLKKFMWIVTAASTGSLIGIIVQTLFKVSTSVKIGV